MSDVKFVGPVRPNRATGQHDEFAIDVIGSDGAWRVAFEKQGDPASWDDAYSVWRACARKGAAQARVSQWAISGVLLAGMRKKPDEEARLEMIVAEYRRRFDEPLSGNYTLGLSEYERLTGEPSEPLERVGREIDRLVFAVARCIPSVGGFAQEGGTEIEVPLPRAAVWKLERVLISTPDDSIVQFYSAYEELRKLRITPRNAAEVAESMQALVRQGGVARRRIWNGTALRPTETDLVCFISYDTRELEVAGWLRSALKARLPDVTVFVAKYDIPAGSNPMPVMLEQHLRRAQALVALCSKFSHSSPWLWWESATVWANDGLVIPLFFDIGANEFPGPLTILRQGRSVTEPQELFAVIDAIVRQFEPNANVAPLSEIEQAGLAAAMTASRAARP